MKLQVPVLLLVFGWMAKADVVPSFQPSCDDSLLLKTPPTVLQGSQYKLICQKYNNMYYSATLYDTSRKIPVYSAYHYKGRVACKRASHWATEPQLNNNQQAANSDYAKSGLDKGHLAPVFHSNTQDCADATFSLTNAAPQYPSFNRGSWRVTESEASVDLTNNCINMNFQAYVVTGVVPGSTNLQNTNVNIPAYFWTALCCIDNNNIAKLSKALWGLNDQKTKSADIKHLSVTQLNTKLSTDYNTPGFTVFGTTCV